MQISTMSFLKHYRNSTIFFPVLILLFIMNSGLSGYSYQGSHADWRDEDKHTPVFQSADSSVTALLGETVYLPCRVSGLGDKVVSWIRTRDLHILTSGIFTYTADSRFEVLHHPDSDDWTLRIIKVQPRDEGKYECQINTDPKMSFGVLLTLRESNMGDSPYESMTPVRSFPQIGVPMLAAATIAGSKQQYVHLGSTITFTCTVEAPQSTTWKPRDVDWYHENRLVLTKAARGGIVLDTVKSDTKTESRLTIQDVTEKDTGRYTCKPAESRNASVNLVVIKGEHTEAMQRSVGSSFSFECSARNSRTNYLIKLLLYVGFKLLWSSSSVDIT